MELRHLRSFVAVAEELHFRRAAERLHVAQPAVSEQIRKLEAELGVPLFARGHRSVALTAAGAAMLPEARQVLGQAERATRAAREGADHGAGELRVGYSPDMVPPWLPRALRAFSATTPGIRVRLEATGSRALLDRIRERQVDVGAICLPAPTAGLRVTPIADEQGTAALPEDHPCARQPSVALHGLGTTRFVALPRAVNPAFYDAALGACSAAGISPTLTEAGESSIEQVLLSVAGGAGAALLPASVSRRYTVPGVRFVALEGPPLSVPVALVTREAAATPTAAFVRIALRCIDRPPLSVRAAA